VLAQPAGPVLAQAAGFAVLAALSPTALLVTATYLGSARPRLAALCYLAGAVAMSTVMGIVVLLLLRGTHLQLRSHHTPRDGLRFGLGLLILAAGAVVAARYRLRPPDPARPDKGIVSRLVASPAPATAIAAGLLIFLPGVTFIAATQVIATAQAGPAVSALGMAMIIVINVAFVWLPFLAYLAAPDFTSRELTAFNAWLRAKGRLLLTLVLLVAGVILATDGLVGLIRGR
jgi:Sap, sulfolipid-1-addressing protein